jgi:hypothetical protein
MLTGTVVLSLKVGLRNGYVTKQLQKLPTLLLNHRGDLNAFSIDATSRQRPRELRGFQTGCSVSRGPAHVARRFSGAR